jgi:hypothetical protein
LSDFQLLDLNRAQRSSLSYDDIEGTPYIDNNSGAENNLPLGKLYTPEMEYITTALIRYNAYTDTMEASPLEDGVDYFLLKKEANFVYLVLKKKTYRAYIHEGTLGYFVILSEEDKGPCTLLKKEKVAFKKAEHPRNSSIPPTPSSFRRLADVLYFKFDTQLVEIPRQKKKFYTLFGQHAEAIKTYVAEHGLKITDTEDLLLVAGYYNGLGE